MKHLGFCLLCLYFGIAMAHAEPQKVETVRHGQGQWELLVNERPYFIKGIVYSFSVIGDDPNEGTLRDWSILDLNGNGKNDLAYESWVDRNGNNGQDSDEPVVGDWRLLQQMGCNTLRVYQLPSDDERLKGLYSAKGANLTFFHPSDKPMLRDLYETYGIMVMIGHFFGEWTIGTGAEWEKGTDYSDPVQRAHLLDCVRVMVEEHKDEPYTLMWVLGNENFNPFDQDNAEKDVESFLTLVNEAARLIQKMDPNHPVAICNWGLANLQEVSRMCPDVDIFGVNSYLRGFDPIWRQVAEIYDRPVVITEFGASAIPYRKIDEQAQTDYHRQAWRNIHDNRYGGNGVGNSIGGSAFIWCDQWHLAGTPAVHDGGDFFGMKGIEWYGVTSQGDGSHTPFMRQLRKSYEFYKTEWRGSSVEKSD